VERHEKQMKEYEKKGYFMTEDGEKSTDLPVKKTRKARTDMGAKSGGK